MNQSVMETVPVTAQGSRAGRPQTDRSVSEPVLGLLLPAVLLGFGDLRFSIGGKGVFTLSPLELWCYLLAPVLIWAMITGRGAGLWRGPTKWLLLYAAWLLVPGILFPFAGEFYPILNDIKMFAPALVLFLAILTLAVRPGDVGVLITGWLIAGVANVALALVQWRTGGPYPVALSETASVKLGWGGDVATGLVTGFFGHPNALAEMLLPWLVVTAAIACQPGRLLTSRRALFGTLGAAFGVALIVSAAKGSVPWAIVGLALAVAMERMRWVRRVPLLVALWSSMIVVIAAAAVILTYRYQVMGLATILPRLEFIGVSATLFADHPALAVIGGGIGRWSTYVSGAVSWEWVNAHNVYLNQMLMYGAVGLGLLVTFLLAATRTALSVVRSRSGILSPFPYVGALFATTGSFFFEPSFSNIVVKHQLLFTVALALLAVRFSAERFPIRAHPRSAGL